MRTERLPLLVVLVLVSTFTCQIAWGGQVVNDDARLWAKQALAQEKSLKVQKGTNTVGVLSFANLTKQPNLEPLQKGIAVMIMTDLSKVQSLTVVERIRVQALVEEMKLGVSGLVENKTAPRVGKLIGAQWLVGGNILKRPSELVELKSRVLDVPGAQVTAEPGSEGMLEGLLRMEKEVVYGIIKSLKIVPTPQEEVELKKPVTTSLKALIDFSKCIDESDRRNYREAAKFCEAALVADPGFGLAASTLQELTTMGVTTGAAVGTGVAGTTEGGTAAGTTAAGTAATAGTGGTAGTAGGAAAIGTAVSATAASATAAGIIGGAAAVGTSGGETKAVSGF